jgi:glyoxylase-like metal-dependent hydrolase (beta-lactamase superfamily II)
MLFRETFPVGAFQCNCTVLACGDTKDAVVIDPGGDVPRIREVIAHHDLTVRAVLHTHAHLDHIYCTREVAEEHGAPIWLHRDDLPLYGAFAVQAMMFGWEVREPAPVDRFFADGEEIDVGNERLRVIHTPGHTPGSVCFDVRVGRETVVFAGDTLFRRSIGRTDLPGGDSRQIAESIRRKLYALPEDALVVPGHGPDTTIGEEARSNPFVAATR